MDEAGWRKEKTEMHLEGGNINMEPGKVPVLEKVAIEFFPRKKQ